VMPIPTSPRFSVVIPTFDRAEKLRRALASVERQTFRDFEVLVCDDGSRDHTGEVVESFLGRMDVSCLREGNWGGPARPRNRGIRSARGEWVCFLDSDDWWYPDKLEAVRGETEGADFVYHDARVYTPRGRSFRRMRTRQVRPPVLVDLMTRGNAVVNSGACIRREILERAGGFSEDRELIAVEDYDLWLRISRITERFVHIPRELGAYWLEGEGIAGASERQVERRIAVHSRHAGWLDEGARRLAEKRLAYEVGMLLLRMRRYRDAARSLWRSV